MATLLLVIIYIAFIGLGLPDSLLGAAWPVAHLDLGVPLSVAGFSSLMITVGTVVSSLLSERLIKAFGTGKVAAVSVFMTAAALMGMGFVRDFWVVLALALPLGLGGGTIDSALNNFVALHYRSSHMNWLHCFWGVGATAGPAIMALYLARNNWHGAYRAISLTLLGISLILAVSLPLWRRMGGGDAAPHESKAPTPRRVLLRLPGAVFGCLAFFTYCAIEFSTGLWASTYFVNVKGVAPDTAASWASLYYLGITLGRLASGFAALKISSRTLVRIGEGALLAGVLAVIVLPGAGVLVGLLLMGVGSAPIFPSLLDQTPHLFGAQYSQGMMGLQFAGAYLGGTLLAPFFGLISPVIGLWTLPIYLLIITGIMVFSTERTHWAVRKSELRAASQP